MKDAMIPRRRLVKVNKMSNRQLATREGIGPKPFFKWNAILKRYEYVVSFFDPDSGEEYQVIMDKKGWVNLTKALDRVFHEATTDARINGISEGAC